jgi:dihydroorotase
VATLERLSAQAPQIIELRTGMIRAAHGFGDALPAREAAEWYRKAFDAAAAFPAAPRNVRELMSQAEVNLRWPRWNPDAPADGRRRKLEIAEQAWRRLATYALRIDLFKVRSPKREDCWRMRNETLVLGKVLMKHILSFFLLTAAAAAQDGGYDLVISGGRVMDPESGLDAVRNLGVRDGKIAIVTDRPLSAKTQLQAAGRVVAPGFIDLHAHGQTNQSNEYQAHDGVTTALELEVGVPAVGAYLKSREGNSILNFGATASHGAMRAMSMREFAAEAAGWKDSTGRWSEISQQARYKSLKDAEEYTALAATMERGLMEGGLGLGVAHQYYPGATREEIFRVFQMAERWRVPIFTHVRSMGVEAMQEMISNAAATGVSLHIVHVNSMSLASISLVLEMIESARKRGLDITTEAYPYTAASTGIQSTIFDEGWQQRLGISYGDVQWVATGERLTKETFEAFRPKGGYVIMHFMKPEWIDKAMASPLVMVASDGMPYAPGAHPRSAGTFSRVLGYYVRERKVLPLMQALAKMTLMPARRLEAMAPQMKNKGRLRVGADADLTVFDAERVRDTATFEKGLSFSAGIDHVIVNGTPVVRDGKTVPNVFPGKAVVGNFRPGR